MNRDGHPYQKKAFLPKVDEIDLSGKFLALMLCRALHRSFKEVSE
jgi:hypothetical protein